MLEYDSTILGRKVDPSVTDVPQEMLDTESLFLFDQQNLVKAVRERVSIFMLNDYIEDLYESPIEYWKNILLREIVSYYSLNTLKLYMSEIFSNIDIKNEIINLLRFLKGDFLKLIKEKFPKEVQNNQTEDLDYNEVKVWITEQVQTSPFLFVMAIGSIDSLSFELFIQTVIDESSQDSYSENI